jgi:midasin
MNPATDNGKKDLPESMRARFTEIYVPELTDASELREISSKYLSPHIARSSSPVDPTSSPIYTTISAYLKCRSLSETTLVDGNNHKPRYTLRTLCRGLSAAVSLMTVNKLPLYRSVFEGFQLAFNTQLDPPSQTLLHKTLTSLLLPNPLTKKELDQPGQQPKFSPEPPNPPVLLKPFWLTSGPNTPVDWASLDSTTNTSKFVLTKTATKHLRSLSRCIASTPYPLLIEGPTSAGKTTLVSYLAARTGHRCVRINNHEHTDVQEYTGSYIANSDGKVRTMGKRSSGASMTLTTHTTYCRLSLHFSRSSCSRRVFSLRRSGTGTGSSSTS